MRIFIVISVLFSTFLVHANEKTKVTFFSGKLSKIQNSAKAEGKLYILDFVAPWCLPCKIMDETTYNDELLADFMSQHFIIAKVNVEDFDGLNLKEKYQVNCLPTLLVFNHNGEIIEKQEGIITGSKLLSLLQRCNLPMHGAGQKHQFPQPIVVKNTGKSEAIANVKPTKSNPNTTKTLKPKPENYIKPNKVVSTYDLGIGLYQLDINRKSNKGFSVQTYVLSQYENVIKQYETAKLEYTKQPILLLVEKQQEKTVYKIMVGYFDTRKQAEEFKKSYKINGYIKDLGSLK